LTGKNASIEGQITKLSARLSLYGLGKLDLLYQKNFIKLVVTLAYFDPELVRKKGS